MTIVERRERLVMVPRKLFSRLIKRVKELDPIIKAAAGVIAALAGVATAAVPLWHWLTDPHDAVISAVYRGIANSPNIVISAENSGTRPGSISEAILQIEWQRDGKPYAFAFDLGIGEPLVIDAKSTVTWPLRIWIPLHIIGLGDGTSQQDVEMLLTRDSNNVAPIDHAKCRIFYHVINSSGSSQDREADAGNCKKIGQWIYLPATASK